MVKRYCLQVELIGKAAKTKGFTGDIVRINMKLKDIISAHISSISKDSKNEITQVKECYLLSLEEEMPRIVEATVKEFRKRDFT